MANGINKAIIVGNLGADPETRYTAGGTAVTNISVATSEQWTDKQSGQKQERTEWHRIVLWQRLAEVAGEYLRKGAKVYIEGTIKTRKWQNRDNQDVYTTEIHAREMQMLDAKPVGNRPPPQGDYSKPPQGSGAQDYRQASQGSAPQRQAPQRQASPANQGTQQRMAQENADSGFYQDDLDDDIPF